MKRTFVAVALAVVFVLALAAPALAATLTHTATYEMEGTIDFKKQAGHKCNTGAEVKQVIAGSGKMDKVQTITQVQGKITMDDKNDWVAGANPLTVTTVWELCTPPKYTYEDAGDTAGFAIPVSVQAIYAGENHPSSWDGTTPASNHGTTHEMLAKKGGWDALTNQIWAVQVKADPGFSGNLHQNGTAAYGPFWAHVPIEVPNGVNENGEEPSPGSSHLTSFPFGDDWADGGINYSGSWRWEEDEDGLVGPAVGADYVGDYFTMEQMARTSQGTLKRYIDMSSPWSHAYLHEDMSVVGKSKVTEAFALNNLPAGADVPGIWWDLF